MDRGRIKEEIKGLLSIVSGVIIAISLITHKTWDHSLSTRSGEINNLLGRFGANLSDIMLQSIGFASYIIPAALLITGIKRILGREARNTRPVFFISLILFIISSFSLLSLAVTPDAGGTAGILITGLSMSAISMTGSYIFFSTLLLISLMYLIPFSLARLAFRMKDLSVKFKTWLAERRTASREKKFAKKQEKEQIELTEQLIKKNLPEITQETFPDISVPDQAALPLTFPEIKAGPALIRKSVKPRTATGDYELPPMSLLQDPPPSKSRPSNEELLERSELLMSKLKDYSIEGSVTKVSPGPIVTMFEFKPAPGVKISKVTSLADDLSMALKAHSIRISPIQGKSTLGIEVPNSDRDDVYLKDIIENEAFAKSKSRLTLALGKDIFGVPVLTDLSKMPHLLIAGATGSGKSVGLNTIVLSILYSSTPDEVKMLMIDPKMLELSAYEAIPHLLMPVITLPKEAAHALKKLVFEMERRYRLLASSGARNIDNYNNKVKAELAASKEKGDDEDKLETLPYIVIFIDEFADLMFASGREVEDSIVRLAQMARAAGIHLVLATQRPSVDVVTGIIKANFPSRIAFQVSSKMDSRIILDTYGAEQLLGKGDMLFTSPGVKMKRIHGAYVSEEELHDVVSFIKSQAGPDYTLFEEFAASPDQPAENEDRDALYNEARDMVLAVGQASISYIQRRMKIGYNRAARIMDMLEDEGIVGPPVEAGKPREVNRRN
ncbi:DNA translocase FtsK 4TM domain-containing protein [bacterium]|nr:DNA translocase FtsK 4TM domain-containing protein [bacterium]